MFFGVQGFFMKLNLGLSTASLALMYSLFGKDIADPLGVRVAPILGSVVAVAGLLVMTRYPCKAPILMTQDTPRENQSIRIHASPGGGPGQLTDGGFTSPKDFGILGSLFDHRNC